MKKIIIITGILIVLVGGYFLYVKLTNNSTATSNAGFNETSNDQGFSITQGKNEITAKYADPSSIDFGVKVYPNAQANSDQKTAGNFNLNGIKLTAATYTTSDARTKVETFYTNQFGSDAVTSTLADGDTTYSVIKSKANTTGPIVNIWVQDSTTYFTILKTN